MNPIIEYTMGVTGFYSQEEAERLLSFVEELPVGGVIVEVGVLYGRSASIYLGAAKTKALDIYLIDPWVTMQDHCYASFHDRVDKHFRDVPHVCVNARDADAARLISPQPHLVHIDGDHSHEGVRLDIEIWRPRVRPGGVMVFHDYHDKDFPGVTAAVDEGMTEWTNLGLVNNQIAFRKP